MLIEDIRPGGKRPAAQTSALNKVRQIHHATKLSTIASQPPQIRPEIQRLGSFDILPYRPKSAGKKVFMSDILSKQSRPAPANARPPKPQPPRPISPPPAAISAEPRLAIAHQASKPPIWRKLLDFMQYPLIAAVALLAAYNSTAGQIMIGLYALFAIFVKVSSKYTFGAALLLLLAIPTFQALGETGISEKCAIYAYELLVVGTLQAIIETWLDNRRNKVKPTTSRA